MQQNAIRIYILHIISKREATSVRMNGMIYVESQHSEETGAR